MLLLPVSFSFVSFFCGVSSCCSLLSLKECVVSSEEELILLFSAPRCFS